MFSHLWTSLKLYYYKLWKSMFRRAPDIEGDLNHFSFDAGVFWLIFVGLWNLVKDIFRPVMTTLGVVCIILIFILQLILLILGPALVVLAAIPQYFMNRANLKKNAEKL